MSNIITNTFKTVKNWWIFLLTGTLLIVGSFWVLNTPIESYIGLAKIFSVVILINGAANIYFSISNRKILEGWGWYLTGGIFDFIVGIALIYYPEIALSVLPIFVGFWLVFRGVQLFSTSLDMKKLGLTDWGWLMLLGIAVSIMGFMMVLDPIFGFLNVIYLTFLALMFLGVSHIILSFQLRKVKKNTIDKVAAFKKDIKKDLKVLRDEIIENMQSEIDEDYKNIDKNFEQFESKMN